MIICNYGQLVIHRLLLNNIKTNCYILEKNGESLLVDPVDNANQIVLYLRNKGLKLRYMIATHGHFDHISAAADIIEHGLAQTLYVHKREFGEVKHAASYCLMFFKRKMKAPHISEYSTELLDFMREWGMCIEHAGGHTKGSCFLYSLDRGFVISGDLAIHHKLNITLFNKRENINELSQFVNKMRDDFPHDALIFPGHGDMTSIAKELEKNKKWTYVQQKAAHTDSMSIQIKDKN